MEKSRDELIAEAAEIHNLSYEEVEQVISSLGTALETIKDVVSNAFKTIAETINRIIDTVYKQENKKQHNYNWHVPQKITMDHQVLNRMPTVPHMRNRL